MHVQPSLDTPVLQTLTETDAPALMDLARRLGWAFRREQVLLFLQTGWLIGIRAGRRLLGSAALFEYGRTWASIGVVMVDPDHQRQGLGRRLVEACLARAKETGASVSLVSTAAGLPLYRSLGFTIVGSVHRMQYTVQGTADQATPGLAHETIRIGDGAADTSVRLDSIRAADWPEIIRFDQRVTGVDRSRLFFGRHDSDARITTPTVEPHGGLCSLARSALTARDDAGQLLGMTLAVAKPGAFSIGPLLATSPAIAEHLASAIAACCGGTVRIDVLGEQAAFRTNLLKRGWTEVMVSPLMVWHGENLPGERNYLFALADPALG
jgi:GNAT superfamily N-acetyltransferase